MTRTALPVVLALTMAVGPASAQTIDADRLPVSLERIKRELAATRSTNDTSALRLQYYIEVYGRPYALDILGDFNLTTGPVPFGAPTHREFLAHVTPQEFRAPAADLKTPMLALLKWLTRERDERKRDR